MSLADAFRAGINSLYAAAGVPATYINQSGTSTSVTAIVLFDLSSYGESVEVQQATATVSVRVSEVAQAPRRGERFVVGSTTYRVISVQSSDELEHTSLVA